MTDQPGPAVVGNPIPLSIIVTNQGPVYATMVLLTIKGAFGQQTYSWPLLNAGDCRFLVVPVNAESPTLLTNSAFLSSDSPDPDPEDNHVELVSRVNEIYGTNLVANPGAEFPWPVAPEWWWISASAFSPIPGWWVTSNLTVNSYGAGAGVPAADSPGPPARGTNYFVGASFLSTGGQYRDLSAVAAAVDSGGLLFEMSAYLGGAGDRNGGASFGVEFFNWNHGSLKSVWLGPVTALDRTNVTALLLRSVGGYVPRGTRHLQFTVVTTRDWPDSSFADDLSFVLFPTESPKLEVGPFGAQGLLLSWPTNKPGYVIQRSPSLLPASWTTVEAQTIVVGNRFTAALQELADYGFYRLTKP